MKASLPHYTAALFAALTLTAVAHTAAAAEPIATTDGEMPGARVEVIELKRGSGGTLMLKFVMHNAEGSEAIGFSTRDYGDQNVHADYGSIGGVHLIDSANRKKYLVVRDSEGNCVCSRNVASIEPGASAMLWARFPAPPEDVKAVSIMIPHFIPMDDVPIGG